MSVHPIITRLKRFQQKKTEYFSIFVFQLIINRFLYLQLSGIMKKEILLVLFFYVIMAVLYYTAIAIDLGIWHQYWQVLLNYALKALLTLPLLWLFFKKLASYPIWKKGVLHVVTMPLFTYVWITVYYALCDGLGIFRFHGSREVWDFYMTILFYCIQFGMFHLYTYSQQLKAQELLSAQLSKLNAQSELSALKAQLNPHFLYNVFNTINAAIPTTAGHARNMINELSDLFRYQLKASREELVSLKEELEFVQKYLDLERERFGERLHYEIQVNAKIEDVLVPPIILQPIVENAIKHGITPLIEGGTVKIKVDEHREVLYFSICDTGKGIKKQNKKQLFAKGIGLSNTDERLLKMYGEELKLNENNENGFCVSFSIPLHKT